MNDLDPSQSVSAWLSRFDRALQSGDRAAATALFEDDCYWRDLVTLTWNLKTMEGKVQIDDMLAATLEHTRPSGWRIDGTATQADGVTEAWLTFETAVARGKGHLRLKGDKCWTLLTTMTELKGFEELKGAARPKGVEHGARKDRKNYLERRQEEEAELGHSRQPYCVIIGGGQGGIALGARLKRLGVPTLIVEKNERAGDSWRKRYKSLCLHDPVWYDHMPYLPFPEHWPVFSPKDKIGDWLEMYTKVMELNYWGSTTCKSAKYDEARQEWTVVVERNGETLTLRPRQLVLATGMSAVPNLPRFPGAETFKGEQHHSSAHPGPDAYRGKKCVVIGSNNSAHDICAALWENGAEVTMVQRSSTHIARSNSLMELALGGLYSESAVQSGIDHHKADLIFASVPYRIMHTFHIPVYEEMKKRDADLYGRLE